MFDERFGRIGIVETLLAEQIKLNEVAIVGKLIHPNATSTTILSTNVDGSRPARGSVLVQRFLRPGVDGSNALLCLMLCVVFEIVRKTSESTMPGG